MPNKFTRERESSCLDRVKVPTYQDIPLPFELNGVAFNLIRVVGHQGALLVSVQSPSPLKGSDNDPNINKKRDCLKNAIMLEL